MKLVKRTLAAIMTALMCLTAACAESYEPVSLNADERYALNLFISNFTEIGSDEISTWSDDIVLVDFAHDHMWFNDYDSFEFGEYSEYPDDGGNNCRVSDDNIQSIINKYFYDPHEVDLSQTRFNYDGEYYYHCETGGWTSSGFAQTVSACPIGGDRYFVSFMVFAGGESWDNTALHLTVDEAAGRFGEPYTFGSALIYAPKLSDRSTYRMISYN